MKVDLTVPPEKIQHSKQDLLQFNVAQLLKEGVSEGSKSYIIENAILPADVEGLILTEPIRGKVKLTKAGRDVWLKATLSTTLQLGCTRCLKPVNTPVQINIEETFVSINNLPKATDSDEETDIDPATVIDETHTLDLTEVLRQELYLNQPSQILCKDDCLGLCPQCGQNLNDGVCSCDNTHIDARWSALLDNKK